MNKKTVRIAGICLLFILLLSTFVIAIKPKEETVFAEPVLADGEKHPTTIYGIEGSVAPGAAVTITSTTDGTVYKTRARTDGSFQVRVMSYADEYFQVEYEGGKITLPTLLDAGFIGFMNGVDFGYATALNYLYGLKHPHIEPGKINFANLGI